MRCSLFDNIRHVLVLATFCAALLGGAGSARAETPPTSGPAAAVPASSGGAGEAASARPRIEGLRDLGDQVVAGVPDVRPEVRERMLQYLNVRSASFVDSEDENGKLANLLISTRFGNAAQLHRVTQPGGARTQLTFFDEPVGSAAYVPGSGGTRVILLRDAGGSEDFQVYHFDLKAGRAQMLTAGKGQHGSLTMARDGSIALFYGTGRNGRDYDTYLIDLKGDMKPQMIYEGKGAVSPVAVSPDNKRAVLQQFVSAKESALLMLDLATRKAEPITPPGEQAANSNAVFSHDGKRLFYTSDRGGEFRSLYRRDLATGKEDAATGSLKWDVDGVAVSPTGSAVVFSTNEDGVSRLYAITPPDGLTYRPVALPAEGLVGAMEFNRAGSHLCLTFSTPAAPADVYSLAVADFGKAGAVVRWTYSEVGGLDASRFVMPTRISFPTFDQVDGSTRMIPAYYFKPAGKGPFPVVINIHGGPEAQYRPAFSGFVQYLVTEMNIAVIAPNVRGSTGYGRSFHMLDDGMKREDSVKDIGKLLVWIALQPELDRQRVCVMGGSYGGYMVLAALTTYPDFIKAGIDIVGIANFVTFLERTRDYRRDLRRQEYGDESDPKMRQFLAEISPLAHADRIRATLFVLHGQNDPRVPLHEAEQIVQRQQQAKRPVWYFMAKGEGHGFRKRSNSDLSQVLYAMFLEEHLVK